VEGTSARTGRERWASWPRRSLHTFADSFTMEELSRRGKLEDADTIDIREGYCLVWERRLWPHRAAVLPDSVSITIIDPQQVAGDRTRTIAYT
jgi:hypothetical protein